MNAIKKADIFSSIVGLRYAGEWRHKTVFGGIIGILALVFTFSMIIYFGYTFLSRRDTRVNLQIHKEWNPQEIEIEDDFKVAAYINYDSLIEDNQGVISLSAQFITQDLKSGSQLKQELSLESCKSSDFPGMEEQFAKLSLEKAFCPRLDSIIIEGGDVSEKFSYIQISLEICALQAEKTNCLPLEDSLSKIDESFPVAHIFTVDTSFETSNYPDVTRKFINNVNVRLTSGDSKETDVFLSKDKLEISGINPLDSSQEIFEEYVTVGIRDKISIRGEKEPNLLRFRLRSSNIKSNLMLSFMSFSEMVANIGGIVNALFIVLKGIVYHYNSIDFQSTIATQLFEYKPRKTNLKESNSSSAIYFAPESPEKTSVSVNKPKSFQTNNFMKTKTVSKRRSSIHLSAGRVKTVMFCKRLQCFCPKIRRDNDSLLKLEKYFDDSQDYLNLFKKVMEIEVIKYLLFDEQQLAVLKYFPKPNLGNNQGNNRFIDFYRASFNHNLQNEEEIRAIYTSQSSNLKRNCTQLLERKETGIKGTIDSKLVKEFSSLEI